MRRRLGLLLVLLVLALSPHSYGLASGISGRIAFVRGGHLWVWEHGQERPIVEDGPVSNPRFSADGEYLAFNRAGALWALRLGGEVWRLADTAEPGLWSPSGPYLAVETSEGVSVVECREHAPRPPRLLARHWSEPAWSPDGKMLAVAQNSHSQQFAGESVIGLVPAFGGQVQVVWRDPYRQDAWIGPVAALTWSADGRWLAFYRVALSASLSMDSNQLTVIPAQGGKAAILATGPVNPAYLQWAPHGATLAFTGDGGGRFAWQGKRIHLAPMPPKPPYGSLTPPGYADREPAWDRDGLSLFFIRSVAKAPAKMFMPGPGQAIWQFDLSHGRSHQVPGTEGALGVVAGASGQLLWPRGNSEGDHASLWAEEEGRPALLVERIDMAHYYYGQFYWHQVFQWWSPDH